MITAPSVPIAKEREGVFKSPDIAIPDSIPVVAGKKRANAAQNVTASKEGSTLTVSGIFELLPKKTETIETTTIQKITPWVFRAKSTGNDETSASPARVQISRNVRESWGISS